MSPIHYSSGTTSSLHRPPFDNQLKKDIYPNFFLVGAPKTGSTSLYYYLAEHPEIFLSTDKEPHFFCTDLHEECARHHNKVIKFSYSDLTEYLELFKTSEGKHAVGEASTSYIYSRDAARNIHNYNPDAKIIVLLRDPIELLHSWYHYLRFTSEEPEDSFARALELETRRKDNPACIPKSVWYPSRIYYRDLVQYDIQLTRYLELFGTDNVRIYLNEDLQENPQHVYNNILEFLQVGPYTPDFTQHNIYRDIRFQRLKWFIDNHMSWAKKFIARRQDRGVFRFSKKLYTSTISGEHKRPPVNAKLLAELRNEFQPLVKRTGELIGRDTLEIWGY